MGTSYPRSAYYGYPPVLAQAAVCTDSSASVILMQENNYGGVEARSTTAHLKVINPDKKSDYKIFLKNLDISWFVSMSELRGKLVSQFEAHTISQDPNYAIGYLNGQTKV